MRALFAFIALLCLPFAAHAQDADYDALLDAVKTPEILAIMREEGAVYGADIGAEFLAGQNTESWAAIVARLYDIDAMQASVRAGIVAELAAEDVAPLLAFFQSGLGRKIAALDVKARRAFLKPATEEAARIAYRVAKDQNDPRLKALFRLVKVNDLVEYNVSGSLTSQVRFFSALVQGGTFEMSEDEVITHVWSQEQDIRQDSAEWLYGFLFMAYQELDDAEMDAYVAFADSPLGRRYNHAVFAGFNGMYEDLSYALGLAVAKQMAGQEL